MLVYKYIYIYGVRCYMAGDDYYDTKIFKQIDTITHNFKNK